MPISNVKVSINTKEIFRKFKQLKYNAHDLRRAFTSISLDYYKSQRAVFAGEGSFGEGREKWGELSEAYLHWKQRMSGPGAKILVLSGTLKKAVTKKNADGSIFRNSPNQLVMGANVPVGDWNLAALHQTGTKKMPKRPVITTTEPQQVRWTRIIFAHIKSRVN